MALLRAIAETQSLTAAAARLGITQSAASHRLKEAERRVGFRLMRKVNHLVMLTDEGERVRAFSESFMDDLARLELDLETAYNEKQTVVRMGQATYSRYHWLPAFLKMLEGLEPNLSVDLAGKATFQPLASLSQGVVDVVTVYGRPFQQSKFTWMKMGPDPLVVAMAPDHRLAEEEYIEPHHLVDERVYAYPFASERGFEWETVVGVTDTPLRRVTTMPTPEAVIDLLRMGFGVGVFSKWAVEPELADGTLVSRPLGADGVDLDWWAVLRAGEPEESAPSRLAQALLRWNTRTEDGLSTLGFDTDP
ncbi:LysR family transcriptional regulator [Pseudovibrio flavus]|uniref:LysR family transcriptional regulator n=1 Tax=Pseudovibrio flavus TaxID=2529854 RepID=UPI00211C7A19|nr:LysR family transcriptional regulator [Pseudovibrio flavus]